MVCTYFDSIREVIPSVNGREDYEEMPDFTGNQTKHLQASSVASRIASRDE